MTCVYLVRVSGPTSIHSDGQAAGEVDDCVRVLRVRLCTRPTDKEKSGGSQVVGPRQYVTLRWDYTATFCDGVTNKACKT